jgi:hypothetical protein
MARVGEEECVTIGCCGRNRLGADQPAGACPVEDDELLAECLASLSA